jgi:acyl-CoA synthetase (AMP-forming)/AMP-acid ligase II
MLPRHVEVMAELPRSPNGKFDRAAIRGDLSE